MDWKDYKKIAIFRKKDLNWKGDPKGSFDRLRMADLAMNEIEDGVFEVTKDRHSNCVGMKMKLSDSDLAKVMLYGSK